MHCGPSYRAYISQDLWDVKLKWYVLGANNGRMIYNKAGSTATLVAYEWAGTVLEKVTRASGQEPYAKKLKNVNKVN